MFLHRKFPRKKHKQNNNATQIERVVRAYLRAKCRVDRPTHANKWTPEGVVFSSANKKREKEKKQERTSNESRSDRPILSRPSKSKKKKKAPIPDTLLFVGDTRRRVTRIGGGGERERERESQTAGSCENKRRTTFEWGALLLGNRRRPPSTGRRTNTDADVDLAVVAYVHPCFYAYLYMLDPYL